jgi:hypothetical protein
MQHLAVGVAAGSIQTALTTMAMVLQLQPEVAKDFAKAELEPLFLRRALLTATELVAFILFY